MAIDKDTVKHAVHLARIRLNNDELDLLSHQLQDIVNFIDELKQLDITGVKPTSHILPVKNVFREDKPAQSLKVKEALSNAPDQKEDFFVVPKIIE
jgi:aspartyl-tRNA(Asn)/glutamyl-tRNA(Gln) amidotransferase subunit C